MNRWQLRPRRKDTRQRKRVEADNSVLKGLTAKAISEMNEAMINYKKMSGEDVGATC